MIDITIFKGINSLYDFYKMTFNKYSNNKFDGISITYKEAFDMAKSRAAKMQQLGFKKGDIIAILALNSTDWLITYIALTSMGVIALPLDTNLKADNYNKMLDQVDAKAIFISKEFDYKPKNCKVFEIDINKEENLLPGFKEVEIYAEDLATLLYTSGTTGNPKIVQLTHGNMFKASIGGNRFVDVKEGSLVLCMLPFYHIFGLHSTFLATFGVGSGYISQPSLNGLDIIKSLADNEINVFPAVPKLWEMMLDGIIDKVKNSSKIKHAIFMFNLKHGGILKKIGLGIIPKIIFKPVHKVFGEKIEFLITGGAALKKEYYKYYYNMGFKIMEGYGLTETTSAICASDRHNYNPGQSGRPLPGNQIKIINPNPKGIGEISFKGHNVFPGYYKNQEATDKVLTTDGWFKTGDLGYIDKKGSLHVTGREKNLIVLDSGKNVYPEELEAFYSDSKLISDIAVFGIMVNGSETVFAVIVPIKANITYKELKLEITRLGRGLPTYKTVKDFAISVDPLPKTTKRTNINSKIIDNLEQGLYNRGEGEAGIEKELTANDPKKIAIINILKDELKSKKLYCSQNLRDFNIDSLGSMNLIVQLEVKLSIKIEEKIFSAAENLENLTNYLSICKRGEGRTTFDELINGKIETKSVAFFNPIFELLLVIFRFLSKILWKVKIYNKENEIFTNSIIAINHQSLLDIMILLSSLSYKIRKDIFITGKKELKFLKFLFPGISYIFVDRKNNAIPALKAGADILRQGKSLIIFPEGTRSSNGVLKEFKTGAAFLAKELKKTIIPMTINGAFKIFPKNRLFPRFITKEKITLTIGKKINPVNYKSIDRLNSVLFNTIKGELILRN